MTVYLEVKYIHMHTQHQFYTDVYFYVGNFEECINNYSGLQNSSIIFGRVNVLSCIWQNVDIVHKRSG